ncbi:MAG: peptidase [Flavipsychrobacter sp.]|jgi:dipeptidyl-peptidase-4|nr:peptidase [Flavipsychrobacter sp.]
MRKIYWLLAAILCVHSAYGQGTKQITLEDIWKNGTFKVKDVPGFKAMKDGKHYTQLDKDGDSAWINVYNLETGAKEKTIFSVNSMGAIVKKKNITIEDYTFSEDEKNILLFTNGEHVYRHSVNYHVFSYNIETKKAEIVDFTPIMHATYSPDAKSVAFVMNNNLYYKELAKGNLVNVTTDGEKNKIINGNCDWVYEEEFSFTKAFQWSPDGKYIAYYRFDERKVPEYAMAKYTGLYPEQYTYKYPKAGEVNSEVSINIYSLEKKESETAELGSNKDQYVPRIKWTNDPSKLCIYRLNRLQNKLELLRADAASGTTEVIYTDSNKYFIDINDEITFLPDGHSVILSSERNGYAHLYNWNWQTKQMNDLTPGNYDIDGLTGIDIPRKLVYYTSTESSPLERRLYAVEWSGQNKKCLTPEKGVHAITPCAGYNFFIDKSSTISSVPVYTLRDAGGKVIRTLEDNKALAGKMKEYAMGEIQMVKFRGVNEDLNAWMITPPGFDKNKKYPVLMYQYSGPGSQEVADRFPLGNYWWHQMLAQKGYIVVCVDGTGTGHRGEEFRKKTYLQLGKLESDDQIAVAKNLGNLPYVDKNRIGIWGWSYGGFMSATCLMKGNDVFKAAISVAPVTNWRYYDNIYTERYMRTPQENPKGYDDNAPEKMAANLKGKLLLVHGTADDNVHFQNSVMLANALIAAGKEYDSEYYPDKAHSISGGATRLHLYNRMTEFILKNL